MKKLSLIIIFVLILSLTSCGHDVEFINIPTASTTGALYSFGNSLANLWNENLEGIRANSQASNGGIDNLNLLSQNEADVSMAVSSNVYQAYYGLEKFENRPNKNIRIIAGLYYNPNQVVVSKDINKIEDLKGKSFAPGAPGSTTEYETQIHFEAAGLKYPEDINPQYVGFTEAIDLKRNNQIDGAWIMSGAPASAVTEMLKTTDTKILEIPEELVNQMRETYPWYSNYTLKAGTYEELTEDTNTSAIKMVMFCSSELDDQLVYNLTKTFFENLDNLKTVHPFLKDVTIETATQDIAGLELHEGAKKYYDEMNINY